MQVFSRFWIKPTPERWDCDCAVLLSVWKLPSGREVMLWAVWNLP